MKAGRVPFADLLAAQRVDLWLNGHIHGGKRTATYVARKGKTTFINVSTTGHAYGTTMSTSYLLELTPGSQTLLARCRDHDDGVDIED